MLKKHILLLIFIGLLAAGALGTKTAMAHPPRAVNLSWNNGTLSVNVDHGVNDPQKHYIYKIVVYVDNKVTMQKEYTTQTDGAGQKDSFSLGGVRSGSTIKVEAFCVIMGSTTGSIKVP